MKFPGGMMSRSSARSMPMSDSEGPDDPTPEEAEPASASAAGVPSSVSNSGGGFKRTYGRRGAKPPTRKGRGSASRSRGQAKVERVMHEFKTGSLKSSSGGKVSARKQAIAIALSEAGLRRR